MERNRGKLTRLLIFFGALVSLFVGGNHPVAAAPNADLSTTMTTFMDAYKRQDVSTMRALTTADFAFVQDRYFGGTTLDFAGFIGYPPATAQITQIQQTGPATLVVKFIFSGDNLPALPHPFVDQVTFTFRDGQIACMVEQVGLQTLQDLVAAGVIPPLPGMPRTGSGEAWSMWWALGLAVCLGGLLLRLR